MFKYVSLNLLQVEFFGKLTLRHRLACNMLIKSLFGVNTHRRRKETGLNKRKNYIYR